MEKHVSAEEIAVANYAKVKAREAKDKERADLQVRRKPSGGLSSCNSYCRVVVVVVCVRD